MCVCSIENIRFKFLERFQFRPAMSSSSNVIGASEHNASKDWSGAFAFSNIGLAGKAFLGASWQKKHAPKLRALFSNLLEAGGQGIFLCEVGNLSDPTTPEGVKRLERCWGLRSQMPVLQSTVLHNSSGATAKLWQLSKQDW